MSLAFCLVYAWVGEKSDLGGRKKAEKKLVVQPKARGPPGENGVAQSREM